MWILWMTSSLSSHSTSASVSELSRLVTHTAVSSPKCNCEKRPLSNSVAFQTLFKWHRYCGIFKIHIVRKINTGIRYEPVYRPALLYICYYIYIYIYAFSRRFYPKRLTSGYTCFCQYMCSLGIKPTTFALLTQCSTTEPQEHYNLSKKGYHLSNLVFPGRIYQGKM